MNSTLSIQFENVPFRVNQIPNGFYVPKDLSIAEIVFGANCGPASLAACLGEEISEIMKFFPHFAEETKRYTNLTAMKAALTKAQVQYEVHQKRLPDNGLVLIQWTGPWTKKKFFSRWALRHTHWIAVEAGMIYDMENGYWMPKDEWEQDVVPMYLSEIPQAAGWAIKYGVEVFKSSSGWQESFLPLLFRRPNLTFSE